MSYYDDYDDDDDEYSSEDEIFYHNYSVDYAKQILGGHHAISSCLPLMRRSHRRQSPRLVRVSTWDQMPIANRQQLLPSLHSRPKYGDSEEVAYPPPTLAPRLPSLESTSEELERRAAGTQPLAQETSSRAPLSTGNTSSSQNPHRPMTEAELMQAQQQQEVFQQHLLNMQRHLLEQTQQQQNQQEQEQQVPTLSSSSSHRLERRKKVSYHDLERDDDQAQIAELIENDPYFAAAMEDFAHSHGLLDSPRHRTHSGHSSSRHSHKLCKRHRAQYSRDNYRPSYSSSSSSSISSSSNAPSELTGSKTDALLFRELHGIRRLMEEYVRGRNSMNPPGVTIMPVPWPMAGGTFPTSTGVHYPTVAPATDYQPAVIPRERPQPPEPSRVVYQNVVNSMKEVIDRRSPSQREQPLKPSQIDPKLKHVYTKRPRIPPSNTQPTSMQRPPLPQQQQQQRRRSSQLTTPTIMIPPPRPPSSNIPPAPSYEALANFSSSRSISNTNRNLSYGNRPRQSNIYDTLLPGHFLRLYNKYN